MKSHNDTIEMTRKERDFIERFTAEHCRPHSVVMTERLNKFVSRRQIEMLMAAPAIDILAAGMQDNTASSINNDVRSPREPVRFVFVATDDLWSAEVVVPPQAEVTTDLIVIVSNRKGEAFQEGVFEIAGQTLQLESGKAKLQFGLFLAGIQKTEVVFTPPGGDPVSGRLMFF
jgi:hypothetical protein